MRISDWSSDVCSSDLLDHKFSQTLQVYNFPASQIVDLPDRGLVRGSKQQCVDAVVDEIEAAQLKAITEHLDGTAFNKLADPDAQKNLTSIHDAYAWSLLVRPSEPTCENGVTGVVDEVRSDAPRGVREGGGM